MEEMIVKEEKHELSPFADSQSFQKIFDIGKMFATSQLVPQNYQGKPMDCSRYGESNGRIPYDGHAESVCCKR